MSISDTWTYLYSNNPKIQAFAVSEDSKIIWQTDNWNLVGDIETIVETCAIGGPSVTISGVAYKTIHSTEDSYYASSDDKGHFLMVRVEKQTNSWLLAWTLPDSIPDLTLIDLKYACKKMA
ncbi:MAG: hypothetical protein P1Q69_07670 [Candidatus Thorarchaeota archaeon]|nr:hypothetical protein [Candidatus Thorarchaeota archaeon]